MRSSEVSCSSCGLGVEIIHGNLDISSLWQDIMDQQNRCVRCGQDQAPPSERREAQVLDWIVLTIDEFYRAQLGLGIPEEQECRIEVIQDLLRTHPVRRVVGKDIPNTNRAVVDYLELWDGTKLYLSAGAGGAVAYRITKPFSYTREALDAKP